MQLCLKKLIPLTLYSLTGSVLILAMSGFKDCLISMATHNLMVFGSIQTKLQESVQENAQIQQYLQKQKREILSNQMISVHLGTLPTQTRNRNQPIGYPSLEVKLILMTYHCLLMLLMNQVKQNIIFTACMDQ